MVNANVNIRKVCSFYVSDWHFVTMLLPHINKVVSEGTKITTILEEDVQEKVEILLKKLKLTNEKKITNISWEKRNLETLKIEKIIQFQNSTDDIEIIISGSVNYINSINNSIEEYVNRNNIKNQIKIIDCYLATENLNIEEILDTHNAVLNTAGEKTIKEFKKSISMIN